ncbi:protein Z-dependent protease inhibitor [Anolis carolinensis]|uniref:Serpin domain-containing protein n=1 Tax=Anolis carolinensis TaxID=28377 RepID=G1KCG5_ANOCA|nr:PREDICTED: protein Z-dependent protease inhibitor [Anolis carolinensis]XP_008105453.1 PREDICTED: protein Z-dependent protease inhibitor [Anolis carolinensis]|eukprot:XP_008105388.1 PREDICTED: protein Z-dependent protease inhibitor [Anolis carolinensis]
MKTAFFLVLFELCVTMCFSNEKTGTPVRETQESFIPSLLLSNDTDEQYPHNTVSDPSREKSKPAFSMHNFTEMNTNFGFNLYRKIAMKHDNNIFFSPLSLSFVLSIFLLASKGETHNQIIQSLNLHLLNGKENQLPALCQQLRNNITKNQEFTLLQNSFSFIQKDFQINEAFHNLSKQYFDMEYLTVDFHNSTLATNIVNEHIKQKTGGRIPALFDAFDQQAKIILVNYFLFRGKWKQPFSMKFTEVETFYIDNYRSVQVPMMFKTERVASTFDKNLQCVVLKLPYKGSVHMLIVMPEEEADFMDLEDHLTIELVDSWLKNMETRKKDIYFPKFKLDQSYHVEELLQDMGIKDLFSYKADLGHLSNQRFMKISQVLQRAVIEVDERGTEAAAVSGSEILAYSLPPTVRVNRPFLFMIYEEILNTLLFMGRVINPTEL